MLDPIAVLRLIVGWLMCLNWVNMRWNRSLATSEVQWRCWGNDRFSVTVVLVLVVAANMTPRIIYWLIDWLILDCLNAMICIKLRNVGSYYMDLEMSWLSITTPKWLLRLHVAPTRLGHELRSRGWSSAIGRVSDLFLLLALVSTGLDRHSMITVK